MKTVQVIQIQIYAKDFTVYLKKKLTFVILNKAIKLNYSLLSILLTKITTMGVQITLICITVCLVRKKRDKKNKLFIFNSYWLPLSQAMGLGIYSAFTY